MRQYWSRHVTQWRVVSCVKRDDTCQWGTRRWRGERQRDRQEWARRISTTRDSAVVSACDDWQNENVALPQLTWRHSEWWTYEAEWRRPASTTAALNWRRTASSLTYTHTHQHCTETRRRTDPTVHPATCGRPCKFHYYIHRVGTSRLWTSIEHSGPCGQPYSKVRPRPDAAVHAQLHWFDEPEPVKYKLNKIAFQSKADHLQMCVYSVMLVRHWPWPHDLDTWSTRNEVCRSKH